MEISYRHIFEARAYNPDICNVSRYRLNTDQSRLTIPNMNVGINYIVLTRSKIRKEGTKLS